MKRYKLAAIYNRLESKGYKFSSLPNPLKYKLLFANNQPIYARVASSSAELAQGLMGVESLDTNEGCLLSFGHDTHCNLYMKNCKINLQAAMIDENGRITDIVNMYYNNPYYIHKSSTPVRYALEMSENYFTNKNIKVGDLIKL